MTARRLEWGYVHDCGCLIFQVGPTLTVKPCTSVCPNRSDLIKLLESRNRVMRAGRK